MQPYFFPYIGYFQLMHVVDAFVFFDDVQYIDRGWVNRNQIQLAGKRAWLSMPVAHAARGLAIGQRHYLLEQGVAPIKRKLGEAYRKSERLSTLKAIEALLDFQDANVARFNAHHLREIASWLGIDCRFIAASELMHGDKELRGERRILALCRLLSATGYINPIGGAALYDAANFAEAGIQLSFLQTRALPSRCSDGPAHLSVIDLLMRSSVEQCRELLSQYEILDARTAQSSAP